MLPADPIAIRAQLGRILASEGFVRCRRMQRFLEYIVEEALAGRAQQLGEYGVGLAVFDRSPDFEPALDPIVRNDARRLRLKLLEYYRRPQERGGVLIEVPKGGYAPVFRSLEPSAGYRLVVNLVDAATRAEVWAHEYDLEPEGVRSMLARLSLAAPLELRPLLDPLRPGAAASGRTCPF